MDTQVTKFRVRRKGCIKNLIHTIDDDFAVIKLLSFSCFVTGMYY